MVRKTHNLDKATYGYDTMQAVLSFRPVLISTGEMSVEAVISGEVHQAHEASPIGQTTGGKEHKNSVIEATDILDYVQPIPNGLTQGEFDNYLDEKFSQAVRPSISMAYLRYMAKVKEVSSSELNRYIKETFNIENNPQPKLIFNIINGGPHGGNALSFCEFMIIPDASTVSESIRIASEVYCDLGDLIRWRFGNSGALVGREGGFSPPLSNNSEALSIICEAIDIRNAGRVKIAIDVAATTFSKTEGTSFLYCVDQETLNTEQIIQYYDQLLIRFPNLIYLEDPTNEYDVDGLRELNNSAKGRVKIVSDDLTVTDPALILEHHDHLDACVLKINQAGHVSKLIEAFQQCKTAQIETIISQRSGETDSNILAHLAAGLGADYMKAGAPARERIVKYNELIRIFSREKR